MEISRPYLFYCNCASDEVKQTQEKRKEFQGLTLRSSRLKAAVFLVEIAVAANAVCHWIDLVFGSRFIIAGFKL